MIRRTLLATLIVSWLGVSAGIAQTAPLQIAPLQITPAQTIPAETTPSQTAPAQTAAPATTPSETVSAGSIGLRSGFDSNPTDTLGARGSMFVTQTINYDYLRGSQQEGIGLSLKAADTIYDPRVAAPSTNIIAAATGMLRLAPNLNLRSTLTTTVDDSWARRAHSVQWRNRIEYDTTQFRVFANVDASLSSLNERDIFTKADSCPPTRISRRRRSRPAQPTSSRAEKSARRSPCRAFPIWRSTFSVSTAATISCSRTRSFQRR